MINPAAWQKKLTLAFDTRNMASLGVCALLLTAFTLGLLLPAFKEAERLAAVIPDEKTLYEQSRQIVVTAAALEARLAVLREIADELSAGEPPAAADGSPAVLRGLATARDLEIIDLRLLIPERRGAVEHLLLRAEFTGEPEALQSLVLQTLAVPAVAGIERMELSRRGALFLLALTLQVTDE